MTQVATAIPGLKAFKEAAERLSTVIRKTPLEFNERYSAQVGAKVYLKREDLQVVRSYKIRGAFNKMSLLSPEQKKAGVVCASAGNHAQGVALSCKLLGIEGAIYMPATTPKQKIDQVRMFGQQWVSIHLEGDTFDDCYSLAKADSREQGSTFVHPFDDEHIIAGQGTVALELLEQATKPIDYLFVPVGGGGLSAGICSVFKERSPKTKIVGVEPEGAASMRHALKLGNNQPLEAIDKFVDGAAVRQVGKLPFRICSGLLDAVLTVPEGKVCQTILDLYNKDAIVVEPAGALSIAALDQYPEDLTDKQVVCVVSGSNNDITRTAEIKERALLFSQLKHYFIVKFPQRSGALRQFLTQVLGPDDDITHFEYTKKTNRENGSAVVGLELRNPKDLEPLITRMKLHNFYGDYLNDKPELFQFLV